MKKREEKQAIKIIGGVKKRKRICDTARILRAFRLDIFNRSIIGRVFSVNALSRRKSDDFRAGAYAARIEKTRAGCFTDFFMRNERVAVSRGLDTGSGFFPSLSLSLSLSLFFFFIFLLFLFCRERNFPPVRLKRRSFTAVISNVQGNNQPRDRRPSIVRLSRPKSEMELDTRGNTGRPFFSLVKTRHRENTGVEKSDLPDLAR